MKKILAISLAVMLLLSFAACGGTGTQQDGTPDEGGNTENNTTTTAGITTAATTTTANAAPAWSDPAYAAYTAGIAEPTFDYTITGILMDQLVVRANTTVEELTAWKQSFVDAGWELYRDDGFTWGVSNQTHNIQMNGHYNGVGQVYIGLQ